VEKFGNRIYKNIHVIWFNEIFISANGHRRVLIDLPIKGREKKYGHAGFELTDAGAKPNTGHVRQYVICNDDIVGLTAKYAQCFLPGSNGRDRAAHIRRACRELEGSSLIASVEGAWRPLRVPA